MGGGIFLLKMHQCGLVKAEWTTFPAALSSDACCTTAGQIVKTTRSEHLSAVFAAYCDMDKPQTKKRWRAPIKFEAMNPKT